MSKIEISASKFKVEKFNGKGNFDLWQKRVKALLVQQGPHKTLQKKLAKSACTLDKDWDELDLKAKSMI